MLGGQEVAGKPPGGRRRPPRNPRDPPKIGLMREAAPRRLSRVARRPQAVFQEPPVRREWRLPLVRTPGRLEAPRRSVASRLPGRRVFSRLEPTRPPRRRQAGAASGEGEWEVVLNVETVCTIVFIPPSYHLLMRFTARRLSGGGVGGWGVARGLRTEDSGYSGWFCILQRSLAELESPRI